MEKNFFYLSHGTCCTNDIRNKEMVFAVATFEGL